MPTGGRDTSYLLFRSTCVVLTGNCCRVSLTPGISCPHGAHLSFTYIHPMSRYIPPNLSAMLTRAWGWQKLLLVAHWGVKHFGGLDFRAHAAERRRVEVNGNEKCQLAGTWAQRTREWLAAMQRCLMGSQENLWQMCCFGAGKVTGGLGWEGESGRSSGRVRSSDLEAEAQRNLLSSWFSFHKLRLC